METKSKHFQMRCSPRDMKVLARLAKKAGVSKSEYLLAYIRRQERLKLTKRNGK